MVAEPIGRISLRRRTDMRMSFCNVTNRTAIALNRSAASKDKGEGDAHLRLRGGRDGP